MQSFSAGLEALVLGLHDGGVVAGHGAAHQELAGDGEEGAQHAARHGRHAQVAVHQTCTVQYSTVQYSTVQYSTVQYSTVQYSTVQYSTAPGCW